MPSQMHCLKHGHNAVIQTVVEQCPHSGSLWFCHRNVLGLVNHSFIIDDIHHACGAASAGNAAYTLSYMMCCTS